jgi:hypothetical protein
MDKERLSFFSSLRFVCISRELRSEKGRFYVFLLASLSHATVSSTQYLQLRSDHIGTTLRAKQILCIIFLGILKPQNNKRRDKRKWCQASLSGYIDLEVHHLQCILFPHHLVKPTTSNRHLIHTCGGKEVQRKEVHTLHHSSPFFTLPDLPLSLPSPIAL